MGATSDPTPRLWALRLAEPWRSLAALLAEHAARCWVCAVAIGMTAGPACCTAEAPLEQGRNLMGTRLETPAVLGGMQQPGCCEPRLAQHRLCGSQRPRTSQKLQQPAGQAALCLPPKPWR